MKAGESYILSSIYVIDIKIYFNFFVVVTRNKTSDIVMDEVEFVNA
jgi:hypothetical protein